MKRPLMPVALFYGGGLLIAEFFQPPLPFLFVCSLCLAVAAILISRVRQILIWPLVVLTGWTNLTWRSAVVSPLDLRVTQTNTAEIVTLRGELLETPSQRVFVRDEDEIWHSLARVQVGEICHGSKWQPACGKVMVSAPGMLPEDFFAGQRVEITGVLAPPARPIARGLFDWQIYLRRQEIYFELKSEGSNDWKALSPKFTPLSDRFRSWAAKALQIGIRVEDESLKLERALTLGDKSVLTDEVSEPFVRAATYHIFAVDGLRMAIIFAIFFSLFRTLGLPRRWCGVALIPLIWFYVELTGWPASAIRAAVMLTIILLGWALQRPSDLINSLFTAALIILVWDPQQLFQAGFQLSFLVVLCMILTLPVFDEFAKRLLKFDPLVPDELRPRWQRLLARPARWGLDLFFTSVAAWLGSIPLVAYYFHIVTPVSAPANVMAVPLCALVLAGNFASLLFAGWLPLVSELFNHASWFLMEGIRTSSIWFANWPWAYRYVAQPGLCGTALYYVVLLTAFTGWLFQPKWRLWKCVGLAVFLLVWGVQWQYNRSDVRLTALPLNGGSAVWFDAPGTKSDLLIDCGSSNAVEFVMKPFLRAQGVNSLASVALTHGDLRHVGGIELLDTLFPIQKVRIGGVQSKSSAYRHAVESFAVTGHRVLALASGDQLGIWTILNPNRDDRFRQADDNALVLRANVNGTGILLLSDLGRAGQECLLNRTNDLSAEIVVSCLPEQGEPLCDSLLDAIRPQLIVVTDSETPARKRATPELRERLQQRGVPVVFTREAGAVTISLRDGKWTAETMSGVAFSKK